MLQKEKCTKNFMQAENLKNIFPLNKFSLIFIEKEITMHGQIQWIDFNLNIPLEKTITKIFSRTKLQFSCSHKKNSLTSNLILRL